MIEDVYIHTVRQQQHPVQGRYVVRELHELLV